MFFLKSLNWWSNEGKIHRMSERNKSQEIYERCCIIGRSESKSESQAWKCDMLHGTHNTRITTTSIRHALQHSVGVIFQGLPPFAFFHNSHQPISRFCINCHVLLSLSPWLVDFDSHCCVVYLTWKRSSMKKNVRKGWTT